MSTETPTSRRRGVLRQLGLLVCALALLAVQGSVVLAPAAPKAAGAPAAPKEAAGSPAAPRAAAATATTAGTSAPRRGVWFTGDFETGGLDGWSWDISRHDPPEVVTRPVRKGRYAVRITLAPGDVAALKPRAELKVEDKDIERVHGAQGQEIWYGWSLLIPTDYADPPGDQWQILAQWHHRPPEPTSQDEHPQVKGPPPQALHLVTDEGRHYLVLISLASPTSPARTLGEREIHKGSWIDLVFHFKCSTGGDGFVEAWLDGLPFTAGKVYGPTLYTPLANYLRLGLYRAKGVPSTNSVYLDEVRIGDSYQAVAPWTP